MRRESLPSKYNQPKAIAEAAAILIPARYNLAMQTGANYEIAKSTGVCASTGVVLAPGDSCMACLCEREEDDGFERIDYSVESWNAGDRPERLFSYWKSVVTEPNARKKVFVDDELLMNLFERLADDERPQRLAFRFVIALVLLRKKKLKHVGRAEVDGGREVWHMQVRCPAGIEPPPPVPVVNPKLSDDDVQTVSDQLGEILSGELE